MYLQFFAGSEFMLGSNQRAATAQIYGLANSRKELSAKNAVADIQRQRIATLRPPLGRNRLNGGHGCVVLFLEQ